LWLRTHGEEGYPNFPPPLNFFLDLTNGMRIMEDIMNKKLEDMIKSLESIKEDLTYGASLDRLPTHNFIKASVELEMIANRLYKISNELCDQTKITE
tara:strand:+ start:1519 stop:1809 length:291 start_codon:yes stop_codon:yes gene_type:complete